MKIHLHTLLIVLFALAGVGAGQIRLEPGPGSGAPGSADILLPILLRNSAPVGGLQFEIRVDSGLLSIEETRTTGRSRGFLALFFQNRVLLFPATADSIECGDGAVLELLLRLHASAVPAIDTLRFTGRTLAAAPDGRALADLELGTAPFEITHSTFAEKSRSESSSHALRQNVPNPFNPLTRIPFVLGSRGPVRLTVHDVTGAAVRTLVDGVMEAGAHEIPFDARHLPSGVYFYRLSTDGFNAVRKMTLVR